MSTKTVVMATLLALACVVAAPGADAAPAVDAPNAYHAVIEARDGESITVPWGRIPIDPKVVVYDSDGRRRAVGLDGVALPVDARLVIEDDRVVEIRLLLLPK